MQGQTVDGKGLARGGGESKRATVMCEYEQSTLYACVIMS